MQSETAYVQEALGAVETQDLRYRSAETTTFTSGVPQKCAFVAPAALRTPHRDLIAQDQQASPTDRENPIASYFLRAFLGCDAPSRRGKPPTVSARKRPSSCACIARPQ